MTKVGHWELILRRLCGWLMMRKSGDLLKWMKTICLRCLGQLVILCAENRLRQSESGCRSFLFVHPFLVGNRGRLG